MLNFDDQWDYFKGLTYERPSWKNQVRSSDKLYPGQLLLKISKDRKDIILIVSGAYEGKNGQMLFKYAIWKGLSTIRKSKVIAVSCADCGLTNYEGEKWNANGRLIKTRRPDMPKFLLNRLVRSMQQDCSATNW